MEEEDGREHADEPRARCGSRGRRACAGDACRRRESLTWLRGWLMGLGKGRREGGGREGTWPTRPTLAQRLALYRRGGVGSIQATATLARAGTALSSPSPFKSTFATPLFKLSSNAHAWHRGEDESDRQRVQVSVKQEGQDVFPRKKEQRRTLNRPCRTDRSFQLHPDPRFSSCLPSSQLERCRHCFSRVDLRCTDSQFTIAAGR